MITVDNITDEQIRELRCATCSKPATCVGRYEDMPEPGEPACDECCGHGCEDGHCDPLYDEDGDITQDVAWYDDSKQGTRMRARCVEILNQRKGPGITPLGEVKLPPDFKPKPARKESK